MHIRSLRLAGHGVFIVLALGSCETNPEIAFPTAQAVAFRGGAGVATLARGRKIYTTSCTECHVARPIAQRSVEQWRLILGVMAPRARLKPDDRAAVEAYLVAARAAAPVAEPASKTSPRGRGEGWVRR